MDDLKKRLQAVRERRGKLSKCIIRIMYIIDENYAKNS